MSNHDSLTIPPDSFFEDSCQFRVPVVDVVSVIGAQSINTVGQCEEGSIDVGTFYHTLATVLYEQE